MPELPEVETVCRSLQELVVGKTIHHVDVRLPRIVRSPDDIVQFQTLLEGLTIDNVQRRGKYLLISLPPYLLISHLRMEGQYRLAKASDEMANHTHVIFYFTDGTELRYRDVRQFGTMDLVVDENHFPTGFKQLGIEPFDPLCSGSYLYSLFQRRSAPIKGVLLDQSCIAGLGNIYVDEALFAAKLHPLRAANQLTHKQCDVLFTAIQDILQRAIDAGGSSVRSYVNGYGRHGGFQIQLHVYHREGKCCTQCNAIIQKIRVAGRGTHFCPTCQRAPRFRNATARKRQKLG